MDYKYILKKDIDNLDMYIYVYIYVYICIYIYRYMSFLGLCYVMTWTSPSFQALLGIARPAPPAPWRNLPA